MVGRKSSFDTYFSKLKVYYFRHRRFPSFQDLTEIFSVTSKKTVFVFFQELLQRGFCSKEAGQYIPTEKFTGYPFFSSVQAGLPLSEDDPQQDCLSIDTYLVAAPLQTMCIEVSGDSMEDAGILDGDIVVVDKKKNPRIGDIVVAQIDTGHTLKYLFQDRDGKKYLHAANAQKNYPDLYPSDELVIMGVVVGSVRKY